MLHDPDPARIVDFMEEGSQMLMRLLAARSLSRYERSGRGIEDGGGGSRWGEFDRPWRIILGLLPEEVKGWMVR